MYTGPKQHTESAMQESPVLKKQGWCSFWSKMELFYHGKKAHAPLSEVLSQRVDPAEVGGLGQECAAIAAITFMQPAKRHWRQESVCF